MPSTKYPCYSAVHIPGVPGTFANIIVEVDDETREVLSFATLDGQPVSDPDTSTQPSTPEAAKAPSASPKPKE